MPKNSELTTNEKLVLRGYRDHVERYGEEPTQSGLARELGMHLNSLRHAYRKLAEKGWMKTEKITVTRLTLSAKGRKAEL